MRAGSTRAPDAGGEFLLFNLGALVYGGTMIERAEHIAAGLTGAPRKGTGRVASALSFDLLLLGSP